MFFSKLNILIFCLNLFGYISKTQQTNDKVTELLEHLKTIKTHTLGLRWEVLS